MILSEARKYGLNLTVANQYVAQMTENVRDAVFGNVGTTISFRVSPEDAPVLAKQFEPTFEEADIIQLNNRNFVISMIINGEKVPAFSATTLSIPKTPTDNFDAIVAHSREYYARPRREVEAEIRETIEQSERYKRELADSGRQEPRLVISSNNSSQQVSATRKDLKERKISPNTAEGRENPGLKDLAKLVAESQAKTSQKASQTPQNGDSKVPAADNASKTNAKVKKGKKKNKKAKKTAKTGAVPSPTPVTKHSTPVNEPSAPKSSTPALKIEKRHYAAKDSSVDGFLAIKH